MSASRIVVDPDNGVAPWRQVRDQVLHLVRTGGLPVGTPLPSIRQLARDLGLSAGTVARVYRELETSGVLHTARRNGTVVAAVPPPEPPNAPPTAAPTPTPVAAAPADTPAATSASAGGRTPAAASASAGGRTPAAAEALELAAARFVASARALGVAPEEAVSAVRRHFSAR
ncbi:GntR family transcriptional regulator [Saccharothrix variisporea]|uniref:Regulatory GntR family protein n=1 Tax=Saccharothrix variisporea TaxID=543527 RepID=A0A495XG95_9PSEU|nr:regulatory GntR family protein [Saccharothrix variisporea]